MKDKKQLLTEVIKKETIKILEEIKRRKAKKKPKFDGMSVQGTGMCESDELGNFFVVMNPSKGAKFENVVFETDVFNLSEKINKGLVAVENIKGMYKKIGVAKKHGNNLLREREASVMAAKQKAEAAVGLKGEIVNKANEFKKTKLEAEQAAAKLREGEYQNLDKKYGKVDTKKVKAKAKEVDDKKKQKPTNELLGLLDKNKKQKPTDNTKGGKTSSQLIYKNRDGSDPQKPKK